MTTNDVRLTADDAERFNTWFRGTAAGSGDLDREPVPAALRWMWEHRTLAHLGNGRAGMTVTAGPEVMALLAHYAQLCLDSSDKAAVPAHRAAHAILEQANIGARSLAVAA